MPAAITDCTIGRAAPVSARSAGVDADRPGTNVADDALS